MLSSSDFTQRCADAMVCTPIAAASCLITLATKEFDNNMKLIVLYRLDGAACSGQSYYGRTASSFKVTSYVQSYLPYILTSVHSSTALIWKYDGKL